jgi:hypothetical protein
MRCSDSVHGACSVEYAPSHFPSASPSCLPSAPSSPLQSTPSFLPTTKFSFLIYPQLSHLIINQMIRARGPEVKTSTPYDPQLLLCNPEGHFGEVGLCEGDVEDACSTHAEPTLFAFLLIWGTGRCYRGLGHPRY